MDVPFKFGKGRGAMQGSMSVAPTFKPGDSPPADHAYGDLQEWADVQLKAGLRQEPCSNCGRWKFPQELSATIREYTAYRIGVGAVSLQSRICLECDRSG